jgi:aspartyl-tRNA(Asn)/glutamyl-tRNA(Gln) amidotransferase subunit A
MSTQLHLMSAVELLHGYRQRDFSPVEVTRAVLERIAAHNERLNAFCVVDVEGAVESARASEQRWQRGEPRGLLDGVPVSVKDLLYTRGLPTRFGSQTSAPDGPWDVDAPAAARLREAGAVMVGKTTTPEFGHKFVTDSPLTGITRNPWNPALTPGGSSGGAGAALAAAMGPLAVGTDGGGSIRIPSAWSGVVGHKPSSGRVPLYPPSRWGTLSCAGPMARSVTDAALLLTVLAGPDARDWYALPPDGRDYRVGLDDGVRGLRLAYSPDLGLTTVQPDVAARVKAAVQLLAGLGAHVEEIPAPGIEAILQAHRHFAVSIFAHMAAALSEAQRALLDPYLLSFYEAGRKLSALDFQECLQIRRDVGTRLLALHQRYDLLLLPSFQCDPPPVPGLPKELASRPPALTCWANHTGQPVASVPCGLSDAGLPVGLQIAGPKYADALVLRCARAYEAARGPFPLPAPA